ncbi:hypothetical protein OQ279_14950 [Salinimicrobium sp. MT39]|uniref:Uncharacterized protein n=1 Tax=Salinimicrobium profundisediminis TaxID=2994553 RepID=A0A9X3CYS2_9FLAO|nr:hypothetical protein [Salinimicrobium profundisediminis]MCX2839447.1 hypothetical protein [Salinimicrobium profundisediminis]
MLKNKTSLYLLFPLVIIIWGVVIYKMAGAFKDEPVILPATPRTMAEEVKIVKRDTFSLLPIDKDPFLGHYYKKPVQAKARPVIRAEKVEWPDISYLGMISDTGKSSEVHILQLNGRQFILEKNQVAEEIRIIGSRAGEVTLLYKGERKIFKKNG